MLTVSEFIRYLCLSSLLIIFCYPVLSQKLSLSCMESPGCGRMMNIADSSYQAYKNENWSEAVRLFKKLYHHTYIGRKLYHAASRSYRKLSQMDSSMADEYRFKSDSVFDLGLHYYGHALMTVGRDSSVYNETQVDIPAQPAMGKKAYLKYIDDEFIYPYVSLEKYRVEGRIWLQFYITPLGEMEGLNVAKGFASISPAVNKKVEAEVVRIIEQGPLWKPAILNNQPVYQVMILPVDIKR